MSVLSWCVLFLWFKIRSVHSTCGNIAYTEFDQTDTKGVNNILKSCPSSRPKCAVMCYNDPACVAFSYHWGDQKCETHSGGPPYLNYSTMPGWLMYGDVIHYVKDELWASAVLGFSSQYSSPDWGAEQVLGEADVYPNYGDYKHSWAQGSKDISQWIEVAIAESMYIMEVHVYEVWHAGGVMRVSVRALDDRWISVWETSEVQDIKESRIFSPSFSATSFLCTGVRLDLDCTVSNNYVEIDAIKVVGKRKAN